MNIAVSIVINIKHQLNCLLLYKQIDIKKLFYL